MTTSALVVGSGVAGLTAALHAASAGVDVTVVAKGGLSDGATARAQGGIAGALFPDDSPDAHARDTHLAGAGLCDHDAVRVLVEEGPARLRELIALGARFDREADGSLSRGLEASHSSPRILHAGGDATGAEIQRALLDAVRAAGVRLVEHAHLVDVVREDGRACGADVLVGDARTRLTADAVVLATGGAGQLFARTTNPTAATGDGIASALRAGAEVTDLEFVQFHPTVLADGSPFLVSEAVRGEGAVLVDEDGRRFALDAHPDGELAPRDVVARAIADRMAAQGGRPVLLDATRLGSAFLARRFPTIDAVLRERGRDWGHEPIPVTPAAHYLMGGVATDVDGRTSVAGLYAVGECARTGVHGANRLASNSLLEGAVFGARAAAAIAGGAPAPVPPDALPEAAHEPLHAPDDLPVAAPPFTRAALQELMWRDAGLAREETGLRRAAARIAAWRRAPRRLDTRADLEDADLLLVAQALVAAALARRGSVGAHHRSDSVPSPSVRRLQEAAA